MQLATNVIQLSQYRKTDSGKKSTRAKKVNKGSVYARSGKIWVDFRYLGERVREASGLDDSKENLKTVRKQLDLIVAEIDNELFEFSKRFPKSKKVAHFSELEGRTVRETSSNVLFGDYAKHWWKAMSPGMSPGKIRDYQCILNFHVLPYFEKRPFSQFSSVLLKKFIALLVSKKNRQGKPLSAKRIRNIMIPLRIIIQDVIDEYRWVDLPDPFIRLKLPRASKFRVRPFSFEEWDALHQIIPDWYKPYFNLAVHTGLRPSEQVALKWDAIDDEFIHIELSRVRNHEKEEMKTHGSQRMIQLRPTLKKILEEQKALTKCYNSPYVFINMHGNYVMQEHLRAVWILAMEKSDLPFRRMYETRHTFASWALALGETPEWVARTLGHVDTSMVYRTYGRYIPNLMRNDGSAFEQRFSDSINEEE